MANREEINRLKEEYKTHYRAMYEAKKRAKSSQQRMKIASALKNMDSSDLFSSMETVIDAVREKITRAEARFEVFTEELLKDYSPEVSDFENELKRKKAKEAVEEIKKITIRYENELDEVIATLDGSKTLGPSKVNMEVEGERK